MPTVESDEVKRCPKCGFEITGVYVGYRGCPECREPFFQYDEMSL